MREMEQRLQEVLRQIAPADEMAVAAAWERQQHLAKPPGSLGELEEISIRLSGVTGKVNNRVEKTRIYVLAADNGVVEEGVSSAPQSVTLSQTINLTRGVTGASALAAYFGDELMVVDVGVNARINCPAVLDRKIAMGTKNLAREPAMTRQQCLQALLTGVELSRQAKQDGVELLGVGEMGIGNTTTSAAVLSVLLGLPAQEVTGRGGGITQESFARKKSIIDRAIQMLQPDPADPVDILSKVGGFDLAAMCGVFLGAAQNHIPVVIDGFISVVAALCAVRLQKNAGDYMFPSHASFEPGYSLAIQELGLKPYLQLQMRLGEGSGCPIAFRVIQAAAAAMNRMATFEEAAINDDYLDEIRKKDSFSV